MIVQCGASDTAKGEGRRISADAVFTQNSRKKKKKNTKYDNISYTFRLTKPSSDPYSEHYKDT